VASAVVVGRGPQLVLVRPPPADPVGYRWASDLDARGGEDEGPTRLPPPLTEALRSLPPDALLRADSERVQAAVGKALGRPVPLATLRELRLARGAVPSLEPAEERRFLLAVARSALARALRTPEEVLVTLTREEERVERAVEREARAAESFLAVPGSSLTDYARAWAQVRASLERHHEMLAQLVRTHARSLVPNLSAVVGERTAARLVSAAGGVATLARMRAGRIQLLGTRRRPSPERGPRYGILYRADGMTEVPAGRRGAYARSLGAIAAIAVRADATTHRTISDELVARRDRRIAQLRRTRR